MDLNPKHWFLGSKSSAPVHNSTIIVYATWQGERFMVIFLKLALYRILTQSLFFSRIIVLLKLKTGESFWCSFRTSLHDNKNKKIKKIIFCRSIWRLYDSYLQTPIHGGLLLFFVPRIWRLVLRSLSTHPLSEKNFWINNNKL